MAVKFNVRSQEYHCLVKLNSFRETSCWLKMEVACSFVLWVSFCQTTGHNIQDQSSLPQPWNSPITGTRELVLQYVHGQPICYQLSAIKYRLGSYAKREPTVIFQNKRLGSEVVEAKCNLQTLWEVDSVL